MKFSVPIHSLPPARLFARVFRCTSDSTPGSSAALRVRYFVLLLLGAAGCGGGPEAVSLDGGADVIPADRFITQVVSFSPGPCAGYGQSSMPGIVEGPPAGGGLYAGSTDVLSLGNGGQIIVSFEPNAIVDGPGIDFIVFENPFYTEGTTTVADAELGEVSVSEDGVTWTSFPCTDTTSSPPFGECAGVHPVLSNPDNGVSPVDPKTAGGDPYDLAGIGVKRARFVRIVDKIVEACAGPADRTNGFDLDAIAIVNAEVP